MPRKTIKYLEQTIEELQRQRNELSQAFSKQRQEHVKDLDIIKAQERMERTYLETHMFSRENEFLRETIRSLIGTEPKDPS